MAWLADLDSDWRGRYDRLFRWKVCRVEGHHSRPSPPRAGDKPRFVPLSVPRDELARVGLSSGGISAFLEWAAGVPTAYRDVIREEIARVASDDEMVAELSDEVFDLDDVDPVRHFLLLSTIGETRNPTAVPALVRFVWLEREREDPSATEGQHEADVSRAEVLEALQGRAAEMLAHIGGDAGDEAVLKVAARHPSTAVRIAAIDGYLFNRSDAEDAKEMLRETVRREDTKFIGMPRFSSNADPRQFEREVEDFYRSHPEERPPIPATQLPPARGQHPSRLQPPQSNRVH